MPLPIGHTIAGLTAFDLASDNHLTNSYWKVFALVTVLANLPDIDVIAGLLFQGNGNAFHRGPTHSLFFALVMAFPASRLWKVSRRLPKLSFASCFLVIFTHIVADFLFTDSSISFLWPLQVHWAAGFKGWGDVLEAVFFVSSNDLRVVLPCTVLIVSNRLLRSRPAFIVALIKKIL